MNEEDWMRRNHLFSMVHFLREKRNDRKIRLFLVACCRRVCGMLTDERLRLAIEVAERFADGFASHNELSAAHHLAHAAAHLEMIGEEVDDILWEHDGPGAFFSTVFNHPIKWEGKVYAAAAISEVCYVDPHLFVDRICDAVEGACDPDWVTVSPSIKVERERHALSDLLRDIFGNPFRNSPPLPHAVLAWNDSTVVKIAKGIYDERRMPEGTLDSGRLAILSDALLDAGCDNEDLIAHCRNPGPHVRGCWALDQILEKT